MIELCEHDDQYLNICLHYRAIQATPEIDADEKKCHTALQNAILYLILAPYDNHQADMKHRILKEKVLEKLPKYKYVFYLFYFIYLYNVYIIIYCLFNTFFRSFLQLFTTVELIKWKDLTKDYEDELKFKTLATNVFSDKTEKGIKRWAQLKNRVSEYVCIKTCDF